jgi:hypothetical protein
MRDSDPTVYGLDTPTPAEDLTSPNTPAPTKPTLAGDWDEDLLSEGKEGVLLHRAWEERRSQEDEAGRMRRRLDEKFPTSLHKHSGQGLVAAECGWAALNWLADEVGAKRLKFSQLHAIQTELWLRQMAIDTGDLSTNDPREDGWFSRSALTLAAERHIPGVSLEQHLVNGVPCRSPLALLGPYRATESGHWKFMRVHEGGVLIKDTLASEVWIEGSRGEGIEGAHTVLYASLSTEAAEKMLANGCRF